DGGRRDDRVPEAPPRARRHPRRRRGRRLRHGVRLQDGGGARRPRAASDLRRAVAGGLPLEAARLTREDIKRVGPDDWRLFREVRLASLRDAPSAFASRLETALEYREADWRERLASVTQFVAFDAEQPVGTAGALTEG